MRLGLLLGLGVVLVTAPACRSELRRKTRAFVAPAPCGQGPYDLHLRADGTTGGDGVEVIACTPRRPSGHVVFRAGSLEVVNRAYGDVADNQRCVAGRPVVTATAAAGGGSAGAGAEPAGPGGRAAAPRRALDRRHLAAARRGLRLDRRALAALTIAPGRRQAPRAVERGVG